MRLINYPLYQVLRELGVSEERALKDVSVRVTLNKAQDAIQQLAVSQAHMQGDIRQLGWMLGASLGLTLLILGKLFLA